MAHYNDFDTNYIEYSRAEICQIFHCFFGKFKIVKKAF